MWRSLYQGRELLINLVKRDLKSRYKSTVLGFFWSFAKPLLIMVILWVVFSRIVRIDLRDPNLPFTLHLLCAILPWMYVTNSLAEAMQSVVANSELIKKARLPLEVFPVSAVMSNLVHFLLAMVVLFGFIFAFGGSLSLWVFALPVVIVFQTFFLIGLALIVSSLFVFYRDVASILEVVLTGWFYVTPIIYPIYLASEKLPEMNMQWAFVLLMLNPMTPIILLYRWTLLSPEYSQPELSPDLLLIYSGTSLIISIAVYITGRSIFNHYKRRFADEL